jgi:hypothetical protein
MALEGVNQGLAGFAQFGQQQLKNKGQRILNEGAQMDLNTKQANQNLALMETFGVVKLNEDTARYELTDNFYEAYQKIPEGERGAIFNGDSLFGAYTDKDGKKKMGELGSAIAVEKKVPTSMKDENGNPTEEGKQFLASGQKGIIIPTKREDGMFSFLTRNRSADESDDEGIVLSPAEFGGLMEFRANKLNVLSDADRARAGNVASQQAGTLQGQGTGSNNVTADDQMDMLQGVYNQADGDENIAGTGSQTDVLGGLLEQWKNKIGEERQSILNAQTQNAAPRQGQIGIDFKNEKAEFFKQINADKVNKDTPLTLLKNTGDFKTLLPSLTAVIDGNFDSKDGNAYPTKTALYNFWKSKEGNEGSSRLSKDWQAVQNDPTQLAELASEYLPAVKQQLTDAGYDLKYLEDFVSGDAKDVTAPVTDVEFPEYPDLSNITTKEGALELLESGKMDNLLTPDLIAEAQKKLTDEGVTDAGSFKKAVKEQRIKNPYAYATIMAMYMAPAGRASATETAVQRNEILNLLATDDQSQTKQELIARQESIASTSATGLKAAQTRFNQIEDRIVQEYDDAILALTSGEEDANFTGKAQVAMSSLDGLLDKVPGDMELGYLKQISGSLFQKNKTLVAGTILNDPTVLDTEADFWYGIPIRLLDKDFWGDIAAPDANRSNLKRYGSQLGWRVNAKGEPVELVMTTRRGGKIIESEQGIDYGRLANKFDDRQMRVIRASFPPLSRTNKIQKKDKSIIDYSDLDPNRFDGAPSQSDLRAAALAQAGA